MFRTTFCCICNKRLYGPVQGCRCAIEKSWRPSCAATLAHAAYTNSLEAGSSNMASSELLSAPSGLFLEKFSMTADNLQAIMPNLEFIMKILARASCLGLGIALIGPHSVGTSVFAVNVDSAKPPPTASANPHLAT